MINSHITLISSLILLFFKVFSLKLTDTELFYISHESFVYISFAEELASRAILGTLVCCELLQGNGTNPKTAACILVLFVTARWVQLQPQLQLSAKLRLRERARFIPKITHFDYVRPRPPVQTSKSLC